MRDAVTLLEQNRIDDRVTYEHVKATLMIIDEERLDATIAALREGNTKVLLQEIERLRAGHIHTRSYIEQLLYRLRDILFENISNTSYEGYDTIFQIVMEAHSKLRSFPDGMMLIETTLLRALRKNENEGNKTDDKKQPKKIEVIKPVEKSSQEDKKQPAKTEMQQAQETINLTNIEPELNNK